MSKFRIIPVIDLLNSEAVHAIKGERKKYKPLKPSFIGSSNPLKIIKSIENNFNFQEIYVADLDSIINRKPNLKLLSEMLEISKLKMMLDPGIISEKDVIKFSNLKINKLILGLETLGDIKFISDALKILGTDKIIVSIDMFQGKIISSNKRISNEHPLSVINQLNQIGIEEIILLDLYRVGQKMGGIPPFYHEIREDTNCSILIGGGIKDFKDIKELRQNKFSGVLIATALYDGTLKVEKLKDFK